MKRFATESPSDTGSTVSNWTWSAPGSPDVKADTAALASGSEPFRDASPRVRARRRSSSEHPGTRLLRALSTNPLHAAPLSHGASAV
jgi:hypothetical protein